MTTPPVILKELKFHGSKMSSEQLVEMIRQFCSASPDYDYMEEESEQYALHIGAPACDIHAVYREPFPLLAFAESNCGLYLANIVPKTVSELSIAEYNLFLNEFVLAFSAYAKTQSINIRIVASGGLLTLENIISSAIARKRFEEFFRCDTALTKHPLDVERLDKFILAYSSYARKPLDLGLLFQYLRKVVGWESKDARWCIDRIQTGFDILNLRKRWYA